MVRAVFKSRLVFSASGMDQMDKASVTVSWERAQRLFDKTVDLEKKRRKSAQARVPSDPNAWYQIRENYEAIILEDHGFSEKHEIEYALWLLHYKRIEEFRAHFTAVQASSRSNASNGGRGGAQPDRIMKIRVQFKAFLSESTGFYHDLMLKIRSRYGLPLGQFSENADNHLNTGKDEAKSAEMKQGLISCHRCLIYLGDLARYKGQYSEGESRNQDFAAASSYYLQAASLCPSSGNPHHQLAILASYSGDELVAVYRHFRSLAAEISFPTAKDNLVIVFEKNRQSYSQQLAKVKASQAKESDRPFRMKDKYKELCVHFVRLNGILFTRTSLETFAEVLSSVKSLLQELLSSGSQEEHNFGSNAAENGLAILRLVAVLVFTVNNVNKKTEGQTYAECLQHTVLVQNAVTATFELVSLLMKRCVQLQDPTSSFLIPGILIFLEWLACCPDVAACTDVGKEPAAAKSLFWKNCLEFLNKLMSDGWPLIDDGDDACFTNMSKYEEGDNESQYGLWEDFELRGFLPLLPAQTIVDFSRKAFTGFDGSSKEKKIRVKRILSAGKALATVAIIDQKPVYFDTRSKQFIVGFEPQPVANSTPTSYPETVEVHATPEGPSATAFKQAMPELYVEEDDEDEEIVFKPSLPDRQADAIGLKQIPHKGPEPSQAVPLNSKAHSLHTSSGSRSEFDLLSGFGSTPQSHQLMDSLSKLQFLEQGLSFTNGLSDLGIVENGQVFMPDVRAGNLGVSGVASRFPPIPQSFSMTSNGMYPGYMKGLEASMPLKANPFPYHESAPDNLATKTMSAVSASSKTPVSRVVRHLGPPPGFSSVPSRPVNMSMSGPDMINDRFVMDDPSRFKGVPSSTSSAFGKYTSASVSHDHPRFVSSTNNLSGIANFPFPGKQLSSMQMQGPIGLGYQDYMPGNSNQKHEHNMPEMQHIVRNQQFDQQHIGRNQQFDQQQIVRNQQFDQHSGQYQGQSTWNG
ncbi:hypothetical protein V2J09_018533 [Rumex salicifolius]